LPSTLPKSPKAQFLEGKAKIEHKLGALAALLSHPRKTATRITSKQHAKPIMNPEILSKDLFTTNVFSAFILN